MKHPTARIVEKKGRSVQRPPQGASAAPRRGCSTPAWLPGCLAAWLPGCLAAWLPGCLAALAARQPGGIPPVPEFMGIYGNPKENLHSKPLPRCRNLWEFMGIRKKTYTPSRYPRAGIYGNLWESEKKPTIQRGLLLLLLLVVVGCRQHTQRPPAGANSSAKYCIPHTYTDNLRKLQQNIEVCKF